MAESLKEQGYRVRYVSGVASFLAAAASSRIPLAEGKETIAILPWDGGEMREAGKKSVSVAKAKAAQAENTSEAAGAAQAVDPMQTASTRIYMKSGGELASLKKKLIAEEKTGQVSVYAITKTGIANVLGTASDSASEGKVIWSIISVILLLFVMYSAKNVNIEHKQKDINEIIKERELALYRNFQKEVATLPSMNYKLKCYRKHVLKGETIRSYERHGRSSN